MKSSKMKLEFKFVKSALIASYLTLIWKGIMDQ